MLDLNRAQRRRDAKSRIASILAALDPQDRSLVLEDLVIDDAPERDAATERSRSISVVSVRHVTKAAARHAAKPVARPSSKPFTPGDQGPAWERIFNYCVANRTIDGIYTTRQVGAALKLHPSGASLSSTIAASAVKRKSSNFSDRPVSDPKFEWVGGGGGKFKLLTIPGGEVSAQ